MALPEPKPFASLGPTLLARKGGARPAMRPQLAPASHVPEELAQDLEDLGWNDMGEDTPDERRETTVLALTPAPHFHVETDEDIEGEEDEPEVLRQQRAIEETLAMKPVTAAATPPVAEPVRQQPVRVRQPKVKVDGRRAAFTLRLDASRHLMLRLASTVHGRSAQALVTQALDQFLADIPEIEALAAQLKRG